MDLHFNELSFLPIFSSHHDVYMSLVKFIDTISKLKKLYPINKIRFDDSIFDNNITEDVDFRTYLFQEFKNQTYLSIFLSIYSKPFLEDEDPAVESYVENSFIFSSPEYNIHNIKTTGLHVSFIKKLPAVSLNRLGIWDKDFITITKADEVGKEFCVPNIFSEETIEQHKSYITNALDPNPSVSDLSPSQKQIHLRHDHGIDVLQALSNRLVNSPYVEEILNSLPFNSFGLNFIEKTTPDGLVYLRLHWTDQGLGLVVRTTAKNEQQLKVITQHLKNQYDNS